MAVQHTIQRGGIYYFNFRLPKCGTVFKKSLRTDSSRVCKRLVKNIIGQIRHKMLRQEAITKESLSDVIETLLTDKVGHTPYLSGCDLKPTSKPYYEIKNLCNQVDNDSEELAKISLPDLERWFVNQLTKHEINSSRQNQIVLTELKKATDLVMKLGESILSSDIVRSKQKSNSIQERYSDSLRGELKEPVNNAPTFNEVLEEWQKTWKLTPRMQREREKFYKWFTHYLGELPVDMITRKTLNGMFNQLCSFPHLKVGSPYYKMTVEQLIEVAEEGNLLPEETQGANLRNGWKHLSPIFTYCIDQEYIEQAPKLTIKLEATTKRGCFTLTQTRQLIDYHNTTDKTLDSWAALIQIFTGCRNAEVEQLRKQDVLRDDDTGILYIRVSEKAGKVKTKGSNRNIPVHQRLIELGFETWLASCEDGRLFPTNLSLTLVYKQAKEAINLPDTDNADLQLSAYSARHRMNTSLIEVGVHDLAIKAITGHSSGSTFGDMTAHYAHLTNIQALKTAIDKVKY
ncbi:tyrosine-type recombinase/integrase [Vibrio alginolyticus]|uniref:site-specific integrase n=1 Tax=Vibrio alginolyticus TaxID=663 RepID=UPI001BD46D91|nr:site-specific integrase [Vibrio alginolyticus]MBS9946878.1 tyrosine-type recombinase/integrase [Vibrio alginolyticus]